MKGNGCCNRKFQLWQSGVPNGAGIPFAPSTGAESTIPSAASPSSTSSFISTSASLASTAATISVSPTPQGSGSGSSSNLAVGVGVGVPLGILLLLNLGFLLFRERRNRIDRTITAADEARGGKRQYLGLPRELGHTRKSIEELDSRQVQEIQGTS